jgi:ferredoxin/flavodoxin---NADP+ reductase
MNPHIVAIFGGAVSGAEASHQLSQRGIRSVVFDQNALPYGKIEDGLPKWHAKLRDKEEANIDEKLSDPHVTFVPLAKLGRNIDFKDVATNWGFSAVFLATGAWRDRPLGIEGIDEYVGKGLYYQNPFMHWYNHFHEPGYAGKQLQLADGALVIGGGLASIDICKALMMETVTAALAQRGIHTNTFDLERGIGKVLEAHGLSLADLGLRGCTLVYRRRVKDMPLFPGETDTPEKLAKAEAVREKVLMNAQAKFLFNVLPCHVPVDKIVQDGRLAGLVLRETVVEDGKVSELPGSDKAFSSPLVISSIGSVSEQLPGVPMKGSMLEVEGGECCRLKGFDNVFAVGNAVTGRGNIKESVEHGKNVSESIAEGYLTNPAGSVSEQFRQREDAVSMNVSALSERIGHIPPPTDEQLALILQRVKALQTAAGYGGEYRAWADAKRPVRLEKLLGLEGHG